MNISNKMQQALILEKKWPEETISSSCLFHIIIYLIPWFPACALSDLPNNIIRQYESTDINILLNVFEIAFIIMFINDYYLITILAFDIYLVYALMYVYIFLGWNQTHLPLNFYLVSVSSFWDYFLQFHYRKENKLCIMRSLQLSSWILFL